MFRFITLLSVAFFFLISSFGTGISGFIKQSEGQTLVMYYTNNYITGENTIVGECIVDDKGSYQFSFESDDLRTYYIDLGTKKAQVVLQPQQTVSADLPPYTAIDKLQLLDPFFTKENILVYDVNENDINYFQTEIEIKTTIYLDHILKSTSPSYEATLVLDSLRNYSNQLENSYLKDYLFYSEAFFCKLSQPEAIDIVKQKYLRAADPLLQNTAFTNLFVSEYQNSFIAPDGLFYDFVSQSIISGHLTDDFVTSMASIYKIKKRSLAELLCVQAFYDASVYAPNYKADLASLMLQLEQSIQTESIKAICRSTQADMQRLMVNSAAPYYELFTLKGKKVPLVLKRKNVLLAFFNTDLYECQQQLRLLEKYKKQYKRDLEIVCVAVYQTKEEIARYLEHNSYEGIYITLWENNYDLLQDYKVTTLPQYYLIGNDGNLIYSPMSSPADDMLYQLESVIEL